MATVHFGSAARAESPLKLLLRKPGAVSDTIEGSAAAATPTRGGADADHESDHGGGHDGGDD